MIEQASLVIGEGNWAVKSDSLLGYKINNGKYYPREMSVVRATTGTRINEDGLVEVVPYNLLSYSEQFDNAAWVNVNTSISSNTTTAPNGTLTADTLSDNATNAIHFIASTTNWQLSQNNSSVYVKKGTATKVYIANASAGVGVFFNLNTGTIEGTIGSFTANITSVGNDWYRIDATHTAPYLSTLAYGIYETFTGNYATTTEYAGTGKSLYIWGAQLVEGTSALDYLPTTDRLDVARIDYSSGSAALLVEPQRTNLVTYSSSFDNAYWTQNATVTANSTISPSGVQDADTLTDASNSYLDVRRSFTISASTAYTFSIFVKKTTGTLTNYPGAGFSVGGGVGIGYAIFNTTTGAVNLADVAGDFSISAKSTSYGDYYRFEMTFTTGQTSLLVLMYPALSTNGTTLNSNAQGSNVFWGAQLEAGSYATSYIPTQGSTVTRNADVISKTGIADLIGQTEGVIFTDFVCNGFQNFGTPISINDGTTSNYIWLTIFANGNIRVEVYSGSVQASITYTGGVVGQRYKVAFAYKQNDFVMYVNGVQIGADSSGNVPLNLSRMDYNLANTWSLALLNINASALFKTRLTNAELATLTTI